MAYQANIDITVGDRKYSPGDVIAKISASDARWLLREGYISEQEKAPEKEAADRDKKPPKRRQGSEKPDGK